VVGQYTAEADYYNQLSTELTNDIDQVAKSVMTMQDQQDSLASVVLQNWRELNLLTAKKGGLCLFLNIEHRVLLLCKSVTDSQRYGSALQDWITHRRQELANSWNRWSSIWNWASWLIPLFGPILMLLLALVFGP
jgi:hypothetical protein